MPTPWARRVQRIVAIAVDQEDGAAVGLRHVRGGLEDHGEQGIEIALHGERARDLENGGELPAASLEGGLIHGCLPSITIPGLGRPAPTGDGPGAGVEGWAVAFVEHFRKVGRDIDAAVRQDPAARSRTEVVLCYPGLHALWMHRVSHGLWRRGFVLVPRFLSNLARFYTGVEIHPGAKIGDEVFIDHGMGVVIGETAEVGDGCVLYKGVVLGGVSQARVRRHPRLGREVVVGSNACVLGAIEVGDGARIGSGSVVVRDVPARSTVVGIPGRIVTGQRQTDDELHADLPDPVAEAMQRLSGRLATLEQTLGVQPEPSASTDNPFEGLVEGRRDDDSDAPVSIAPGASRRARGKKP